jgi:drug/metabolite transporter (DMT)-like permease
VRRSTPLATALVALSACCFGSIAILVTIAQRGGTPLVSILAARFLLGAIGLFAVARVRSPAAAGAAAEGRAARLMLLGGPPQAVINLTSLFALRWIPVATLVFLFYTYPSWIAVIAAVRRTERLDGTRIAALALSLTGIAIMVGAPSASALHPMGVALALFAALVYALYIPFIGKLSAGIPATVASGFVAVGASISFVAIGLAATLSGSTSTIAREALGLALPGTGAAWVAVILLAAVSTVAGFALFLTGLSVLGPVRTGIVSTVEPFWAALLGAVVLHQPLGGGTLIGGVAIALAVMLLQVAPPRSRVTAEPRSESVS